MSDAVRHLSCSSPNPETHIHQRSDRRAPACPSRRPEIEPEYRYTSCGKPPNHDGIYAGTRDTPFAWHTFGATGDFRKGLSAPATAG